MNSPTLAPRASGGQAGWPAGYGLPYAAFYIALFAGLCFVHLRLYPYAYDDAYIHFRIAESLLEHGSPYYNPGEAVMTSTSSGWTLTLAAVFLVFGPSLKAVAVFSAAVTASLVYVYSVMAGEAAGGRRLSQDAAVFIFTVPVVVYSSVGMMETPMALLVAGLGVLLYLRGRPASFMLLAASAFFRPELVLLLGLFLAFNLYSKDVRPAASMLYSALGAAPFVLYGLYFFGTVIPQSIHAKQAVYQSTWLQVLVEMVPRLVENTPRGLALECLLIAACLALAAAGMGRSPFPRKQAALFLLPLTGLMVLGGYMTKAGLIHGWYRPLFAFFVFVPLAAMFMAARSRLAVALLAVALVPYLTGFASTLKASVTDASCYPNFYPGARVKKYVEVSRRLYAAHPDYTLMSSEIGGLGWGFKGKVYDAVGLLSDDAVKYHPMKVPEEREGGHIGAIPPGYVEEVMPDVIVSYDIFAVALNDSEVIKNYVMIMEDVFTKEDMAIAPVHEVWGSRCLRVFIRKDRIKEGRF